MQTSSWSPYSVVTSFFDVISAYDFIEHILRVVYAPHSFFSICEFDGLNRPLFEARGTVLVIYA